MSLRRRVTFMLSVVVLASVLPPGTPPALASTEGLSNNFFGTGAGANNVGERDNSFFGGNAGNANTTGFNNSFFGHSAGVNNTMGSFNSFFGHSAGIANTSGFENAFFGNSAGANNTTGSFNAFFGRAAGAFNTTGVDNAFFGFNAGLSNTTACCNAFFGESAGRVNTTGTENAFFGQGAGAANTSASFNAFFGRAAGIANTTGAGNAFFGRAAGQANTTASENSFFGGGAGQANTTGNLNSFFGGSAGLSNTTGVHNSFFGQGAGFSNTTACCNAFFGRAAGLNSTGAGNAFFGESAGMANTTENANSFIGAASNGFAGITNATALGHRAQVSQSDSLVLGSINGLNGATSDVKVGIGTPTPEDPLHVRRTDGSAKVLVEEASGTMLGRELFQLTNNGASRFRVSNTNNGATWDFQSSGGGGSFVIDRVGGGPSLDFELQPDGDLVVRGTATATSFITSSDRNLKTDITPANARRLMSMLRELDISTWRFKNEPEGTVNLGPMAQDFHRLFGMGTERTIDVRDLAALALVAAQAQQEVNNELRAEIDELREAVANPSS